ncbi:DUF5723 family protein [soil metagenome]
MKRLCTIIVSLLIISTAHAQEMLGIANSNYAGTNGISLNPSSMVDSRLEMDVTIGAIGISGDNDYLFLSRDSLKFFGFKRIYNLAGNRGYSDKFSFSNTNKQFNAGVYALLRGPSAIFHLKKHWLGITTQMRGAASINGVGAPIAKFAYEKDGLKFDPLQGINFDDATFDIAAMVWSEIGLSYGHEIYNKDKHYLKGAFTVKRLFGYASAFVKNRGVNYNVQNDSLFTLNKLDVQYGHTFDEDIKNTHYKNLVNGSGWGFDFGIAYEYRPDFDNTRYEMDGERIEDPNESHYKLKVGFSVYDIGKITFDHDAKYFDLSESKGAVWAGYDTINFINTVDFDKRVSSYAFSGDSGKSYKADHYSVGLPHALSLQVDYNVWKGFYTNATWIQGIHTNNVAVGAASLISVTPRYEFKWFEAALPLSMYQYSAFRLGLAFRLGSLVIGSDKFGSLLGLSNLGGMDVYLALKFSLPRNKVKDSDADGVSDKRDKCRGERGTWATLGCPDRDNDGILDKEDSCPDVKGIAKFQGCPDTDNDGIQDNQDDCPQTPGLPQFKGCPDTDGDNIPDPQDSCVTVAGIPEFNGCPDTDGDHIPDQNDSCPTEKGLIQYNGCPDTDGDGLIDKVDSCPQVAGPAANHGCPVIEKVEVKEPVKVELTKEEEEVINKVFKNLEFETGKSVIRNTSFNSLDELSVLMQKKPKFKLLVDGHTDNVGKAPYNLKLSQSRAEAVKKYLAGKGVDSSRITPRGYGMTKPIASNKTPDGRQKNRRVEFTIVE